jgi:bifunctional non-homologous end joining protein LigD
MMARPGEIPANERPWSFEVKWDGVRAIAYVQPGRLRLESRNLNDITDAYPEVRGLVAQLGMHEAVVDGEIVAFDGDGRPSFERLQRRMHVTSPSSIRRLASSTPVLYAMFDLLYLDGHSLTELPYRERRERLGSLELAGPAWRVPAAHPGQGGALLEATEKQGLEGIVAKRLDSRYEAGRRTGAWLKIKHTRRQELVIGGWIPGEGRRAERIGALLMGYYDRAPEEPELRYVGKVGTGFDARELDRLEGLLAPLRRSTSPFAGERQPGKGAIYVDPELVAEVEFNEWTRQNMLRHPSYKGLREDKRPTDVVLEAPEDPAAEA